MPRASGDVAPMPQKRRDGAAERGSGAEEPTQKKRKLADLIAKINPAETIIDLEDGDALDARIDEEIAAIDGGGLSQWGGPCRGYSLTAFW